MWQSGDFCDGDRQMKLIALPLAHAHGVVYIPVTIHFINRLYTASPSMFILNLILNLTVTELA